MKDNGKHLQGVIPAIITPMDADGRVDYRALEKQVGYLSEAGVQGFFMQRASRAFSTVLFPPRR